MEISAIEIDCQAECLLLQLTAHIDISTVSLVGETVLFEFLYVGGASGNGKIAC
jgi:hypothetical protein